MNVSYNKLSGSLPGEIRKMSLKTLNASYNSLTGVPGEIGQQPNLKNINFSYNQITGLPNEIANIPVIDVLDLSYNSIDSISDLSKFKNIRVLKLTGNKLSTSQISQLQAALPNTQIISN
jgi:Leucine-rich repeat (LRR) protein